MDDGIQNVYNLVKRSLGDAISTQTRILNIGGVFYDFPHTVDYKYFDQMPQEIDESFDLVIVGNILEQGQDPVRYLKQLLRKVSPGGAFIWTDVMGDMRELFTLGDVYRFFRSIHFENDNTGFAIVNNTEIHSRDNELVKIFAESGTDKGPHHHDFGRQYDALINRFRMKRIRMLEIGVFGGKSLLAWRSTFPYAEVVVGIDIDPKCLQHQITDKGIFVEIGDQSDAGFLAAVNAKYGPFDFIIDDGSHCNHHVIASFETLFPLLKDKGLYIVEDLACYQHSNWINHDKPNHVEYFGNLIRHLNKWNAATYVTDPFKLERIVNDKIEMCLDRMEFGNSYMAATKLVRKHWVPSNMCLTSLGCKSESATSDFGFVILRHVRDVHTDMFWQEAYRCVRRFYNEPIIILDDNSNQQFVTEIPLINCQIVKGEHPGRGELLPYIYFHEHKPWPKMVFIHDSVFINGMADFQTDTIKFLWEFPNHVWRVDSSIAQLAALKDPQLLLKTYFTDAAEWRGCFGVMSVITSDFLAKLVTNYNLFRLTNLIMDRTQRMGFERIFGLLCHLEDPTLYNRPTVYGSYLSVFENSLQSYMQYLENVRGRVVEKILTGR